MTDLTPMLFFLAAISMEGFIVLTALTLVLLSLLIVTTKVAKILQ